MFNADDDRIRDTVGSRDELFQRLEEIARNAFYNNVPVSEGDPIAECDEYGIVEGVFFQNEEKLRNFFGDDDSSGV